MDETADRYEQGTSPFLAAVCSYGVARGLWRKEHRRGAVSLRPGLFTTVAESIANGDHKCRLRRHK